MKTCEVLVVSNNSDFKDFFPECRQCFLVKRSILPDLSSFSQSFSTISSSLTHNYAVPPKINISLEKGPFQENSLPSSIFQGQTVSFRGEG